MAESVYPRSVRILFTDLLFSLLIVIFYIIGIGCCCIGHNMGYLGDGWTIGALLLYLWFVQLPLSFFSLLIIEIFGKKSKRRRKIGLYALTNSIILLYIHANTPEITVDGYNTILLYNAIGLLSFSLLYSFVITKKLKD